jgi:hypothetical protein
MMRCNGDSVTREDDAFRVTNEIRKIISPVEMRCLLQYQIVMCKKE